MSSPGGGTGWTSDNYSVGLSSSECGTGEVCCLPGVPIKTDPLVYFDDNYCKYLPILIFFPLLQQENYSAQKLGNFSHLTFIIIFLEHPVYLPWIDEYVCVCVVR